MPHPPDTPPSSSPYRVSPRAVAWLKRQLCLLLTEKHGTRSDAECAILSALQIDPEVRDWFDAKKKAQP